MADPIDVDSGDEISSNEKKWTKVGDKRKSEMWNYFSDIRDSNTGKILNTKCKYCDRLMAGNTNDDTSDLRKHLSTCMKCPNNVDKKQEKISVFRSGDSVTISSWDFDQNSTRLALAKMVIMDEHRFSIVEREGFRLFCNIGMPQFVVPSLFTVVRDCKKIYNCERVNLHNTLKGLKSRIALTTDCWTSNQNFNYICLTAHFIDDDWKLHKRILNFQLMDSHRGVEIGKVVESCILQWGIENKLSCITVDNAGSNDVAVKYLKTNFAEKLVLGGDYFHIRCVAHILNLIVKDGIDKEKESLEKIRAAIKYVRSSPSRSKLFAECVGREKITFKGSVSLDVCTRWNSTYIMLNTALKFQKVFKRFAHDDNVFKDEVGVPSEDDWKRAKILCTTLEQFYESTKRMSGTLYCTSNMHFHEVLLILKVLKNWEIDTNDSLSDMSYFMKEKFDKYYGDLGRTNVMVLVGVVLDPRYKMVFVKYSLKKLFTDDLARVDAICERLSDIVHCLYDFYAGSFNLKNGNASTSASMNDGGNDFYVIENMRELYEGFDEEVVGEAVGKSELDQYLEAPREPRNNDSFDILKWWNLKCDVFKVLASMAKDILAVPISTVASESTFSTSGRVLDQFRSSLGPQTVETLICAQDWLRSSNICIDIERQMDDIEKFEEELDDGDLRNIEEIVGNN